VSTLPVIAVIHATAATMTPVKAAFAEKYPDADLWHLLDDRLVTDAERAGGLTDSLHRRMSTLIGYAVDAGAEAVQLACSMYGPVAADASHEVPVLASDQAMFEEVVRLAPTKVSILASLRPSAEDSAQRLGTLLAEAGQSPRMEAVVVHEAKAASAAGDMAELARVLTEAAADLCDTDVIVLAQYSLSPARAIIADAVDVPVLSGPHLAAATLATVLETDGR
jgi:aspartate/glutamate racemase